MNLSGGLSAQAAAAGAAAVQQQQPQQGNRNAPSSGGSRGSSKQFVADMLLVRARPMYGYYEQETLFIKVIL
jgi:hypothetical protein